MMLGVQRPGVTIALALLQNRGIVSLARGVIVIRDRQSLEMFAGRFYGTSESEQKRLLGRA